MKRLSAAILSVILACLVPVAAFAAGWETDEIHGVKKYQKADGQYAAAQWVDIEGKQYYFYTTGEMATGWVKDGDNWYYCENSGERRYSDLKTDVFTFKIDKKTGICSNFTDNRTPSEQAGWWPTNLGNDELVKEAALGYIVFYNNQWWTTPEAAWIVLNPVTVYEHDISADSVPADRFTAADLQIEEPQQQTESITGLWW